MYNGIYAIIEQYIFDGVVAVGSYQELVTILLSSLGTVFLVSIPFLALWRVITMIVKGW